MVNQHKKVICPKCQKSIRLDTLPRHLSSHDKVKLRVAKGKWIQYMPRSDEVPRLDEALCLNDDCSDVDSSIRYQPYFLQKLFKGSYVRQGAGQI